MRSDRERLLDILEAIEKIQTRLACDPDVFFQDELLQVWAIHYIQIIGEAASRLSADLTNHLTDVPWRDIVSMRNVVVHHYFGIDLQQIWDTVEIDLPNLKQRIEAIIKLLDG